MSEKKAATKANPKVAFVTGGGIGLGKTLVEEFLREGYSVAFTYRTEHEFVKTAPQKYKNRVLPIKADASDFSQVTASVEQAISKFQQIDVLVNNASSTKDGPLDRCTPEGFDYTMRNTLFPVFNYSKVVSEYMKQAGHGKIINIGSVNGIHGREGSVGYTTAKAGIIGFTKTIAKELGKYPINCNVVAPGYIATEGQEKTSELIKKLVLSECYIKRLSDPIAICNMVLFLASEKADNITGQVFQVDCGQWI
ncbi:MAG: SDR family oxidoreductase [Lachnospiraceae bacterium]|nr:SDR family oxidoreductase [Lachnospiraceae bacterium]